MTKNKADNWIWMPHAGHFILGSQCRFKLNTYVNGYIVSTVGEYVPDSAVRTIIRQSRGWLTNKEGDSEEYDFIKRTQGGEEIGFNRKYETMVFKATKCDEKDSCCPYRMNGEELDFEGYNKPEDAYNGHLRMCEKWDKKTNVVKPNNNRSKNGQQ